MDLTMIKGALSITSAANGNHPYSQGLFHGLYTAFRYGDAPLGHQAAIKLLADNLPDDYSLHAIHSIYRSDVLAARDEFKLLDQYVSVYHNKTEGIWTVVWHIKSGDSCWRLNTKAPIPHLNSMTASYDMKDVDWELGDEVPLDQLQPGMSIADQALCHGQNNMYLDKKWGKR